MTLVGEAEFGKGIRAKLLRTSAARMGTWREDTGDWAESGCGLRERELACPRMRSTKEKMLGLGLEASSQSGPSSMRSVALPFTKDT